jgi:hypothetical protein
MTTPLPDAIVGPAFHRSSENLRESIRRPSPSGEVGQESSPQQDVVKRAALLEWLARTPELLEVWQEHFDRNSRRRIRRAEIEVFLEKMERVNDDVEGYLYSEVSLLSRLGYGEEARAWKAELAEPFEVLTEALYPYNNALAEIEDDYRKDPAKIVAFEKIAYMESKQIRLRFARYKSDLDKQIVAIRGLIQHGK